MGLNYICYVYAYVVMVQYLFITTSNISGVGHSQKLQCLHNMYVHMCYEISYHIKKCTSLCLEMPAKQFQCLPCFSDCVISYYIKGWLNNIKLKASLCLPQGHSNCKNCLDQLTDHLLVLYNCVCVCVCVYIAVITLLLNQSPLIQKKLI